MDVKLTIHLHLVPRSRTMELYNFISSYVFVASCLINYAKERLYLYLTFFVYTV
jgi:hypothetical protein